MEQKENYLESRFCLRYFAKLCSFGCHGNKYHDLNVYAEIEVTPTIFKRIKEISLLNGEKFPIWMKEGKTRYAKFIFLTNCLLFNLWNKNKDKIFRIKQQRKSYIQISWNALRTQKKLHTLRSTKSSETMKQTFQWGSQTKKKKKRKNFSQNRVS